MEFSEGNALLQYYASVGTRTGLILKLRPPSILSLKGLGWNFRMCQQ